MGGRVRARLGPFAIPVLLHTHSSQRRLVIVKHLPHRSHTLLDVLGDRWTQWQQHPASSGLGGLCLLDAAIRTRSNIKSTYPAHAAVPSDTRNVRYNSLDYETMQRLNAANRFDLVSMAHRHRLPILDHVCHCNDSISGDHGARGLRGHCHDITMDLISC